MASAARGDAIPGAVVRAMLQSFEPGERARNNRLRARANSHDASVHVAVVTQTNARDWNQTTTHASVSLLSDLLGALRPAVVVDKEVRE